MAINLKELDPGFRLAVEETLRRCAARGVEMRPYNGLRSPLEQAKLWRQSRSTEEIQARITDFRTKGAPFLAECIKKVGAQHGDHVTNAPPGLSWHQWGEGVDCFWAVDGKAEWSAKRLIGGINGYQVYADEGEAVGLTAGGHWPRFKDWPHLQARAAAGPLSAMSLVAVNDEMKRRFGP